jgi:hypothetical protein
MSDSSLDRPEKPAAEQAGSKGERVWRTPRLVAAEVVAVTEKDPLTIETTFGAPS